MELVVSDAVCVPTTRHVTQSQAHVTVCLDGPEPPAITVNTTIS